MAENIFFFVPNIIGYLRIILSLLSFYYMPRDHVLATSFYITSQLMDALDGYFARKYNQSTKFGAMLDQLTDRCSLISLLVVLSLFYPEYLFAFQLSMSIDIASHWLYIHASLIQGKTNHKLVDLNENIIMRTYYQSKPVLFTLCAGNELFYCSLYLLYFTEGPLVPFLEVNSIPLLVLITAPIAVAKTIISLIHLMVGSINLGRIDLQERKIESSKKQ